MYEAVVNGNLEAVKLLLYHQVWINRPAPNNKTELYIAADKGFDSIVKILVEAGARYDLLTNAELTPLSIAAKNGHLSAFLVLLPYYHKQGMMRLIDKAFEVASPNCGIQNYLIHLFPFRYSKKLHFTQKTNSHSSTDDSEDYSITKPSFTSS